MSDTMRVLLVDGSGTMRTIQKRCLNKLGVEDIAEAHDGAQALALFTDRTFDIVLTDWNIPKLDGLTLLKEIRKRNPSLPVVMITTEADRSRVLEAIQAGVSDYLVKPFTPEAFKTKLEKWVSVPA